MQNFHFLLNISTQNIYDIFNVLIKCTHTHTHTKRMSPSPGRAVFIYSGFVQELQAMWGKQISRSLNEISQLVYPSFSTIKNTNTNLHCYYVWAETKFEKYLFKYIYTYIFLITCEIKNVKQKQYNNNFIEWFCFVNIRAFRCT